MDYYNVFLTAFHNPDNKSYFIKFHDSMYAAKKKSLMTPIEYGSYIPQAYPEQNLTIIYLELLSDIVLTYDTDEWAICYAPRRMNDKDISNMHRAIRKAKILRLFDNIAAIVALY
jgi:hypothetical protein